MTFQAWGAYFSAMKTAALLIVVAACGAARAQNQPKLDAPAKVPAPPPEPPPAVQLNAQPAQPQFKQRLAPVTADGKVEPLDGMVELRAFKTLPSVTDQTREQISKLALSWVLDVQQQVIDNIDFVAELEPFDGAPGFFDSFDPQNGKMLERVNAFAKQLNSAGSLVNQLAFRRRIDTATEREVRQAVYEYDMAVLQQVTNGGRDIPASTRHQYRTAYRDAMGMFHSLLDRAQGCIEEAAKGAKLPESSAAAVAKVKSAKGKSEVRSAVKGLLQGLNMAQRRALLNKVRDLSPVTDPFSVL